VGTRGFIARQTPCGFSGRYHHNDSYPAGLGKALYRQCRGHFKGDHQAMLRVLIDDHPGSWSTIVGGGSPDILTDFNLEPGLIHDAGERGSEQRDRWNLSPQCYCHGDGREKNWQITQDSAASYGCEWGYIIDRKGWMAVMCSYGNGGSKMVACFGSGDPKSRWLMVHLVDLAFNEEPDWEGIVKFAISPTSKPPAEVGWG